MNTDITAHEKFLEKFLIDHNIENLPIGLVAITGEDLAIGLYEIRKKDPETGEIIYYEKDLLELFKNLEFPEPKWSAAINKWQKK